MSLQPESSPKVGGSRVRSRSKARQLVLKHTTQLSQKILRTPSSHRRTPLKRWRKMRRGRPQNERRKLKKIPLRATNKENGQIQDYHPKQKFSKMAVHKLSQRQHSKRKEMRDSIRKSYLRVLFFTFGRKGYWVWAYNIRMH